MKKYIPYIALGVVLIAGGVYYAVSAKKNNNSENTHTVDHAALGNGSSGQPVDQSRPGYDVQMTSDTSNIKPGQSTKISYKVVNTKKEVLKDFTIAHEKLMHFILVRKDLQNFQHLHPEFNQQTGEFSVNVTFPADGTYRLFPDFTPTPGNPQKLPVTLNYDINVGDQSRYKPTAVTPDSTTTKTMGAYTIDYYFPDELKSQTNTEYGLTVSLPNELVELEAYLGAMGHSVIIKEGSLDFIHAHSGNMMNTEGMEGTTTEEHSGHQGEPDTIDFSTTFPSPGTYKIFTQFQHKGKVTTTDYVIKVN